jgi:hypothetical protein
MKDIGRQGKRLWAREAWTWLVQSNYPEKVFVIERLRYLELVGISGYDGDSVAVGDLEYRFGYYIVGKNGRVAGRWTWGQFSPMIPRADLAVLLAKARTEGTLHLEESAHTVNIIPSELVDSVGSEAQ